MTLLKATKLINDHEKFDMIFSANTITHISNFNSVFYNVSRILSDNGTFIIEEPSLLETIKKNSYDQFYNEHIYVLSAIALKNILKNLLGLEKRHIRGSDPEKLLNEDKKDLKNYIGDQ